MTRARIGATEVNLRLPADFGAPGGDGGPRTITFPVKVEGSSQDDCLAKLSAIGRALQLPCDIVLAPNGATRKVALRSRGGGVLHEPWDGLLDLSNIALADCTVTVEPWAYPANRVFLASPIGDSLPSSADVVVAGTDATFDATHVYAAGGHYMVYADTAKRGGLYLYGAVVGNEVLVCELDYKLALTSGSLTANITFLDAGSADIITWGIQGQVTSPGRGHLRQLLRAPANAVRFRLTLQAIASAGATLCEFWNIHVGEKVPAAERTVPTGPSIWSPTVLPEGWAHNSVANAVWDYGTTAPGWFTVTCSGAIGAEAYMGETNRHAVVPGRVYGVTVNRNLTRWVAGTAYARVYWYDSAGAYLSYSTFDSVSATGAALVYGTVTAPDHAATGKLMLVLASGSNLDCRWGAADWGEHICEAPGLLRLGLIPGEAAAPLDVIGDVDVESDAHRVLYGVAPRDLPAILVEAESVSGWGSSGDANAHGAAVYVTTSTTYVAGTIDTSAFPPGSYRALAMVKTNNAANKAYLKTDQTSEVFTTSTTYNTIDLGQVVLPARATIPGTAATLTVSAHGTGGSGCYVDYLLFVPADAWQYHGASGATAISDFDVIDGQGYADKAADYSAVTAGRLAARRDELLVVHAENAAGGEPTHLVSLLPLAAPRYSLWA